MGVVLSPLNQEPVSEICVPTSERLRIAQERLQPKSAFGLLLHGVSPPACRERFCCWLTTAPRRAASSKLLRVRVLGSKNRVVTSRPPLCQES